MKIATDRETGNSRGFGWISFESKDSADSCVATLAGAELQGRTLKVDISQPKGERTNTFGGGGEGKTSTEPKQSVYVGNLSYETTSQDLGKYVESLLGPGRYIQNKIVLYIVYLLTFLVTYT